MKKLISAIAVLFLIWLGTNISYSNAKVTLPWKPPYQPVRDGDKYTFDKGVLYQRAGCVPQLIVTGTYNEMGRQYGALLSSEIKYTLDSLDRMLAIVAHSEQVPLWFVRMYVKLKAKSIAQKLPPRFIAEMQGMAQGSGLPYEQVLMVNMIYDIFRLRGCTSILVRGLAGEIYHGHTTDIGWGMDWPKTIMVQYHPADYNWFTSITWPGFVGTQTAYNSKGLCYSEDTLYARKKNSQGFSVNFLARIVMEEYASLEETVPFFNQYNTINGEALVLSDVKKASGWIIETTPAAPVLWAYTPLSGKVLWGINRYLNPELAADIQDNIIADCGFNLGRTRILNSYFDKDDANYTLDQVIAILRSSIGPDGKDYARNAYLEGVCNAFTQQMLIYDPQGKGLYLATGPFYASRNDIWYYPDDFSKPPRHYLDPAPYDPVLDESGRLLNSITSRDDYYQKWNRLAQKYPNEAFLQIYAGQAAMGIGNMELWSERMRKAYQLEPDLPEHQIEAAGAAFSQKEYQPVIKLLETVNIESLSSRNYKALYLALLAKSYQMIDRRLGRLYNDKLRAYLKDNQPLKKWLKRYLNKLE